MMKAAATITEGAAAVQSVELRWLLVAELRRAMLKGEGPRLSD
ncbi:hypothetical protein [Comamonas odontotermitis]